MNVRLHPSGSPMGSYVYRLCTAIGLLALCGLTATGCSAAKGEEQAALQQKLQVSKPDLLSQLSPPIWIDSVQSACRPPLGWNLKPAEKQPNTDHQLWISPTAATAYGVIEVNNWLLRFASNDLILSKFLENMKKSDGRADLKQKENDRDLGSVGGMRFVVEGGKYTLRANLISAGGRAWIIYAGTANDHAINTEELTVAETARELTVTQAAGASAPTGQ